MSQILIDKLMRFANDPAATPAERETYRAKAESLRRGMPPPRELLDLMRANIFDGPEFDAALRANVARTWPTTYATGKAVSCCCSRPGATMRECGQSRNLKNPCPCACHPRKKRNGATP